MPKCVYKPRFFGYFGREKVGIFPAPLGKISEKVLQFGLACVIIRLQARVDMRSWVIYGFVEKPSH